MINIDAHKLVGCITMFVWVNFWWFLGVTKDRQPSDFPEDMNFLWGWVGLLGGIGSWYLIARFVLMKDSPQDNWSEIQDDWSEIDE